MLLVTGGGTYDGYPIKTTETFVSGSSQWKTVGILPLGAIGLKGVSIDNKILVVGMNYI